jgi:hypothetical protein
MSRTRSFAAEMLASDTDVRDEVLGSDLFPQLRAKLKTVSIDGETYYVAEGDTLLDEDQLAIYAFQRQKEDEARRAVATASAAGLGLVHPLDVAPRGLLGLTQNGRIVRWQPGFVLTYRVARDTFSSTQNYQLAADSVQAATQAWEQTCGVKFEYRSDLDAQPGSGPAGAVFSVRQIDAGGDFIAAAFFPNDPPARRRVLIDPSFFSANLGFDRVGVLRHELGHVLGFQHEHIRSGAPPVCPHESLDGTIDLTKYDPQSVMHYFCGGVGSRDLKITELDRIGSQRIYGPPLNGVEFITA